MENITIKVTDRSKRDFLLELLSSLAYVEVAHADSPPAAMVIPNEFGVEHPGEIEYFDDSDEGIQAMADDEEREREALEWIEGTLMIDDEPYDEKR